MITHFIDLFRKGQMVANPALWKNIGGMSAAVAGLLTSALAVATALGYQLEVDHELVEAAGYGVAAVLFCLSGGLHYTTSDKVGLPPKNNAGPDDQRPADKPAGSDPTGRVFDLGERG